KPLAVLYHDTIAVIELEATLLAQILCVVDRELDARRQRERLCWIVDQLDIALINIFAHLTSTHGAPPQRCRAPESDASIRGWQSVPVRVKSSMIEFFSTETQRSTDPLQLLV